MDGAALPFPQRSPGPLGLGVPWSAGERAGADLVRFLEAMPAAFCFLDEQWRFRYVNAEAERLIGRCRSQLAGTSLWDTFPGPLGSDRAPSYRAAVESGEPLTFEAPWPGPSRSGTWLEIRVWPGPSGVAVHVLDVTARRRAADAAGRAAARTALLAQVSAELSGALDGESALGRLARLVVPVLTDGCIVTVVDREGRARDVGSWHTDPARRDLLAEYMRVRLESLPVGSPVARALQAGTPVTESVETVLRMMRRGPARNLLRTIAPATAVVLPLSADGRTVGVLTMYQDHGRDFGDDDLDTARLVADQAARAVARVHLQSQQAQLVEGLQRSLLTDPPAMAGMEVVVRYVPAAEAARVGGDWYDAFLQRDGTPIVVIGDVVGHDTAAAAAMGQLRGLLRGIAHHSGAGPAEVLRGLDEAIASMHTDTLATAVVARLECPGTPGPCGRRTLRWANAGHPPPIVLAPDGTVSVLGGVLGDLMLGVDASVPRAEPTVDLLPGSTVLLYTDGLVERRGSTLDEGDDRLLEQLRQLTDRPLPDLCDALLERLLRGTPEDDVAIVAVRLAPR
ncbi:MAG: putative sensor protein [Blastococcus sp.]|nr:putative sensor protein [Blastococcus sp.]